MRIVRIVCIVAAGSVLAAPLAMAQTSVGRGAPDPLEPELIVGSEGKGMYPGAGVPQGNTPIFAARDGAVPEGITPLPRDIFSTRTIPWSSEVG